MFWLYLSMNLIGLFLIGMLVLKRHKKTEIKKKEWNNEIRVEAEMCLLQIYDNDKTPPYRTERYKQNENSRGELPGSGQRWRTPREIIEIYFDDDFNNKMMKFRKGV